MKVENGASCDIYCCECRKNVAAELITGWTAYPHREGLRNLYFWQCPICKNFVGTHKNMENRKPLGNIPNKELKKARQKVHAFIDPLWKSGIIKRGELYAYISHRIGYEYHTGETKTVDECERVIEMAKGIKKRA